MTNKQIGDYGEKIAVRFLRLHGYAIKERNWRTGHWELDLIASTGKDIVFVEVKTRTYTTDDWELAPPPGHAVHAEKQRLTRLAAKQYLLSHPTKKQPRMDVIEIWLLKKRDDAKPKIKKIHHIKAAY